MKETAWPVFAVLWIAVWLTCVISGLLAFLHPKPGLHWTERLLTRPRLAHYTPKGQRFLRIGRWSGLLAALMIVCWFLFLTATE